MKNLVVLLLLMISCIVGAATEKTDKSWQGWVSRDGKPVPNTDAMKSIGGFGGWLIVTPDLNWEEKWNTPTDYIPTFNEASQVKYGQELTILTFYINPMLNNKKEIDIICDIKVKRPDGVYSIDAKNIQCAIGKLYGDQKSIRLTTTIIKYVGEKGDPPGIWEVDVNLIDKNRKLNMPLRSQFELLEKNSD